MLLIALFDGEKKSSKKFEKAKVSKKKYILIHLILSLEIVLLEHLSSFSRNYHVIELIVLFYHICTKKLF